MLNQISTAGFRYNDNGNQTYDGVNSYTWDRANRLLSMGGSSYAYDGVGNRIAQTVGVDVTKYLLDLQPGLAMVLQATQGSDTTRYVHAPHGIHAQQDASDNWTWMLQDGLGSVRSVVDSSLNPLESRLYEPYGTPFGASGTNQTNYGFTGELTDANDLLYLRARYYAPSVGTFTGLDPFEGMAQRPMSLNGYSWVEGNVINRIDPSGKRDITTICFEAQGAGPYGAVISEACLTVNSLWNAIENAGSVDNALRGLVSSINEVFTQREAWGTVNGYEYFAISSDGTLLFPNRAISSVESSQFQQALDYYAECGRYAPDTIGSCAGTGAQGDAIATPMPGIDGDIIQGEIQELLSELCTGLQSLLNQLSSGLARATDRARVKTGICKDGELKGGVKSTIPPISLMYLSKCRSEAIATLGLITLNGPFPYRQDNTWFRNRPNDRGAVVFPLDPAPRDYYREYTVVTPGAPTRGARRIITGGTPGRTPNGYNLSELYYSDDHYDTAWRIVP